MGEPCDFLAKVIVNLLDYLALAANDGLLPASMPFLLVEFALAAENHRLLVDHIQIGH